MRNKKYLFLGVISAAMLMTTGVHAQMHVDAVGNVGIGTVTPGEALDIRRTDSASRMSLTSITSTNSEGPQMIWQRASSTGGIAAATPINNNLGAFSFRGHNGTGFTGSRAFINVTATENWAPGANGTSMIFQVTPAGTSVLTEVMRINSGELRIIGDVIVDGTTLNVPDYVFEDDYKLMTLDQLSAFIEENKHLPGVASAKEVNSNGLDLAGSQLSVLEKVEELTLYTLQQHEELKQLAAENAQLKESNRQALSAYHSLINEQSELRQLVNALIQNQNGSIELTSLK